MIVDDKLNMNFLFKNLVNKQISKLHIQWKDYFIVFKMHIQYFNPIKMSQSDYMRKNV